MLFTCPDICQFLPFFLMMLCVEILMVVTSEMDPIDGLISCYDDL